VGVTLVSGGLPTLQGSPHGKHGHHNNESHGHHGHGHGHDS